MVKGAFQTGPSFFVIFMSFFAGLALAEEAFFATGLAAFLTALVFPTVLGADYARFF